MSQEYDLTPSDSAAEPQGFDEIDELFNLGGSTAELRQELEAALVAVDQAKQSLGVATLEPSAPKFLPVQPSPSLAPSVDLVRSLPSIAPTARHKTATAWVAAFLVAALVAINVFMVVAVSRSNAALADAVAGAGSAASQPPPQVAPTPASDSSASEAGTMPEGYHALDRARTEIEHGEHAFARRRLYSLLSVVDGIQEPARGDIEARAGLAIGDSYRLQARTLASAANGGER